MCQHGQRWSQHLCNSLQLFDSPESRLPYTFKYADQSFIDKRLFPAWSGVFLVVFDLVLQPQLQWPVPATNEGSLFDTSITSIADASTASAETPLSILDGLHNRNHDNDPCVLIDAAVLAAQIPIVYSAVAHPEPLMQPVSCMYDYGITSLCV